MFSRALNISSGSGAPSAVDFGRGAVCSVGAALSVGAAGSFLAETSGFRGRVGRFSAPGGSAEMAVGFTLTAIVGATCQTNQRQSKPQHRLSHLAGSGGTEVETAHEIHLEFVLLWIFCRCARRHCC